MFPGLKVSRWLWRWAGCSILLGQVAVALAQEPSAAVGRSGGVVVQAMQGKAQINLAGAQRWLEVDTNTVFFPGDRLRVGADSHLVLRFGDQSIARIRERSELEFQQPAGDGKPRFAARVVAGILYFFHRGKPADVDIETRMAAAAVRGTEFNLEVTTEGVTILTVLEGEVQLKNALGEVSLRNGEQGVAGEGTAPERRTAIDALNVIQWTLHYPGIIDPAELDLTEAERSALAASLEAYRLGDLYGALREYPAARENASEAERIYHAGLVLAQSQVGEAEGLLRGIDHAAAHALRSLIATVQLRPEAAQAESASAAGWMAESYRRQASADLPGALAAARNAGKLAPGFGYARARIAELEFGFGHTREAAEEIDAALGLSPLNAQAIALRGFLFAAQGKYRLALSEFERAIATDPLLANGWLGRGLVRIRTGDAEGGRVDLLAAAALEPQRAFLRSYLGKAWADAGDRRRAEMELAIAKQLDPRDPTAWLYSALLHEQYNEINEAVRDLERSQELNDNRAVYRSEVELGQDRAVRSANLARIYRDAGMSEWSVLTAGRAVSADYANYSAHLFLANSYALEIDPINRRYETPANAEFLIANLLAPVGAGVLSPAISAHEYSHLLERNGLGFVSTTEYLSRGAWTEQAAQFGTFDSVAYSVEGFYQTEPGQRPNADFETRLASIQIKPRLTAADTLFLRADYSRFEAGDTAQRYEPLAYNPSYRTQEEQLPTLLLGYHREWSPESHTLLLASRVEVDGSFSDPFAGGLLAPVRNGSIYALQDFFVREQHRDNIELYTLEPQQIWRGEQHTTTLGVRAQSARLESQFVQFDPSPPAGSFFPFPPQASGEGTAHNDFSRLSAYGYHQHFVLPTLQLVGGLSYDYLSYPRNWRFTPVMDESETKDQLSPRVGFVWMPWRSGVFRGAYTRSLAGATVDQSYQIEPTQIAGFNQSYRAIIPETVAGANTGAEFETFALSFEQQFPTHTFLALSAQRLNSDLERVLGIYSLVDIQQPLVVSGLPQQLDYTEDSVQATVNQLIAGGFALSARYRLSKADYDASLPTIGPAVPVLDANDQPRAPDQHLESILHHARFSALYNEPHGFFVQADAGWYEQSNQEDLAGLRGSDFWQFDVYAGYRSPRRNLEFTIGLLNLADQDYRLTPLNLRLELPRSRTLLARTRISF